jgi:hypothetical protein
MGRIGFILVAMSALSQSSPSAQQPKGAAFYCEIDVKGQQGQISTVRSPLSNVNNHQKVTIGSNGHGNIQVVYTHVNGHGVINIQSFHSDGSGAAASGSLDSKVSLNEWDAGPKNEAIVFCQPNPPL